MEVRDKGEKGTTRCEWIWNIYVQLWVRCKETMQEHQTHYENNESLGMIVSFH